MINRITPKKQSGFTLVELLVTLGILAIGSLGIMRLVKTNLDTYGQNNLKIEMNQFIEGLNKKLQDEDTCNATFKTKIINQGIIDNVARLEAGVPVVSIKMGDKISNHLFFDGIVLTGAASQTAIPFNKTATPVNARIKLKTKDGKPLFKNVTYLFEVKLQRIQNCYSRGEQLTAQATDEVKAQLDNEFVKNGDNQFSNLEVQIGANSNQLTSLGNTHINTKQLNIKNKKAATKSWLTGQIYNSITKEEQEEIIKTIPNIAEIMSKLSEDEVTKINQVPKRFCAFSATNNTCPDGWYDNSNVMDGKTIRGSSASSPVGSMGGRESNVISIVKKGCDPENDTTVLRHLRVNGQDLSSGASYTVDNWPSYVKVKVCCKDWDYFNPKPTKEGSPLFNNQHTDRECEQSGGEVITYQNNRLCSFTSNNNLSCPSGWNRHTSNFNVSCGGSEKFPYLSYLKSSNANWTNKVIRSCTTQKHIARDAMGAISLYDKNCTNESKQATTGPVASGSNNNCYAQGRSGSTGPCLKYFKCSSVNTSVISNSCY